MKKRLTIFAAATAAALMLAACSGGSGSGTGSSGGGAAGGAGSPGAGEAVSSRDADAEGTGAQTGSPAGGTDGAAAREVELMFWYWADNTEQSDLIQGIVEDFNRDNGRGITVKAEEYPWNGGGFSEDTFTAVMGGGGPDVSTFKLSAGKMYAANQLLADMSSYVENWDKAGQISDSVWDIMRESTGNGQLNVMPWTLEPLYVYYRPSYFEKAGVSVPETFDQWLECIEKCTMDTDGDGQTDVYGYGLRGANGGQEHLGSFLYAYGADWSDLTTPEAVEAYKAYLGIYENGWAPESAPNAGYAELVDGFKTGLTAMMLHHVGSSSIWLETFGDDVDAFVMPGTEKGQWTCTGDTELVVYEQCKDKEAAFAFIEYMITGDGGSKWFKGTGKSLGTDNITSTPEYAANPFQAVSSQSIPIAGVLPPTDTVTEFINSVWSNTNQQALLGQVTPEDALKIMNQSLNGQ